MFLHKVPWRGLRLQSPGVWNWQWWQTRIFFWAKDLVKDYLDTCAVCISKVCMPMFKSMLARKGTKSTPTLISGPCTSRETMSLKIRVYIRLFFRESSAKGAKNGLTCMFPGRCERPMKVTYRESWNIEVPRKFEFGSTLICSPYATQM